jgi:hypothetical protein
MEETQKIFEPTRVERDETIVHEPDATLATPRFDEVEAQVARPVVPLAGRPARSSGIGRRQWPIALVLISALAGGVVSLLAFRLYQQRQQTQAVVTETGEQQQQTPAADATQSPEPAGAAVASTEEQAQSGAPVVFEEFDPAKEGGAISDAAPTRPKATADAVVAAPARKEEAREERREEPKPAPRAAEPKPRLVETLPAPRQVEARHEDARRDDRRDEDFYDRRRERRRERREQRREQRRNIDRIKDIFEGAPPS